MTMPRRNHPRRRWVRRTPTRRRERALYFRDTCGKLRLPTYATAVRIAGQATAGYGLDDEGHTIYHCRWSGGYHLSSRTPSEVDSRRAYYRHHEEATAR